MTARSLPENPDLDQLKRQAKELLKVWRREGTATSRLRDAQRAIAEQYGFASWDALRLHVERLVGAARVARRRRNVLDYDDPVPDVITLSAPFTQTEARQLAARRVGGVNVDASVPSADLAQLARIPTLARIDFSNRDDLVDADVAFLESMPWLTAVSFARCGGITDRAVTVLRGHEALQRINLQWTNTGDAAIAALVGKPALSRVLVGSRLTDSGAARLRDFPALAVPGARDAFLGISTARGLTDDALASIGALNGVIALDVHMSVFGSPHYTARGAAHLRRMESLEELNFHGALATDAVLTEIAGIPRLRTLHCQDAVSGDDGFVALGGCTTLEGFGARVCPRMGDRGFAAIARLPRLTGLGVGGPRVTDAAMASAVDAPALVDLQPIMFGDDAFVHIGRMRRLKTLTNMYNRATTDRATEHLRGCESLIHYSAFGTQITDTSLGVLAGLPSLESLEFENCRGITDEGLRELTRIPRLRRLIVWSCPRVAGTWVESAPRGAEVKSEGAPPEQNEGYVAETLLDYPDLAVPEDARPPLGSAPSSGLLSRVVCFGVRSEFVDDGLRLAARSGVDTRWIAIVTRDVFSVPLRIELEVRPITELRLVFSAHNRFLVLDNRGHVGDPTPWFLKTGAAMGQTHGTDLTPIADHEWARVTVEIDERERRLFVNGELRHTWHGDFAGIRSRIGIGVQRSELTIRRLNLET